MTAALESANAALRSAVRERLDNTPKDDPKMVGYSPESCCEGQRLRGDSLLGESYAEWRPPAYSQATVAEQTIQAALEAVRDRHGKYGPPAEHFSRTAALVNAAFGTSFSAADWALVMVLDKVARLRGPTPTTDGGVDIAGYGGCYEECRSNA